MKMKKILLIAALSGFVMNSCKKDYTCECTATINGSASTSSFTIHETKTKATTLCEGTGSSLRTCKMK
jgi:hypothetical protein